MSNLTITGRVWRPGTHRHHDGSDPGAHVGNYDYVPGFAGTVEATWPVVVRDGDRSADFLFAAASEGRYGQIFTGTDTGFTFHAGNQAGSLIGWYRDQGGDGPPGLYFDAFSLEDNAFLDWGDDFEPFTVTPGDDRPNGFATTTSGGVTVTAESPWPGRELVFDQWLVVSGPARTAGTSGSVELDQGRSATAFAVYATPKNAPDSQDWPWPPYWARVGDPSRLVQNLVRYGLLFDQAARLDDAKAKAAIRTQVLSSLVSTLQAEQTRIEPAARSVGK